MRTTISCCIGCRGCWRSATSSSTRRSNSSASAAPTSETAPGTDGFSAAARALASHRQAGLLDHPLPGGGGVVGEDGGGIGGREQPVLAGDFAVELLRPPAGVAEEDEALPRAVA